MTVEDNELLPDTTIDTPVVDAPEVVKDDIGDAYDRAMAQENRDPANGRFVAKNLPAEAATPPAAGEGAVVADASSTVAAVSAAPAHLPQAIKQHWDKYGPEAQAAIATHQAEMDRKFGEIGKQYGAVKPIADKIMGAAQQFPEFKGFTPDQIADGALALAAVQARLESGSEAARVSTIMEVAKSYGVLPALAQAFGQQGGDNQLVTGLQQQIANLEAQISKAGNPENIREQITAITTERETETAVRAFATKDGVKEYWADVEARIPDFIRVIQSDQANSGKSSQEILEAAYDMAINALPAVREKVRAAEAAKATAAAADPARTAQQRKAASINVRSISSGERPLTELEAMSSAYDRAMAN